MVLGQLPAVARARMLCSAAHRGGRTATLGFAAVDCYNIGIGLAASSDLQVLPVVKQIVCGIVVNFNSRGLPECVYAMPSSEPSTPHQNMPMQRLFHLLLLLAICLRLQHCSAPNPITL